jgi:hypothetical protein
MDQVVTENNRKIVLTSVEQKAAKKLRRQQHRIEILEDEETLQTEHKSAYASLTVEQKESQKIRRQFLKLEKIDEGKKETEEDGKKDIAAKEKHNSYYNARTIEQIKDYEKNREEAIVNYTEVQQAETRQVYYF